MYSCKYGNNLEQSQGQIHAPNPHTKVETPLIVIRTYNGGNPNIKERISKYWPNAGRSSATRDMEKRNLWFHIGSLPL